MPTESLDLDVFLAEQDLTDFEVKKAGKVLVTLPHFNTVPAELALKLAGLDESTDDLRSVFVDIVGEEVTAVLMALPVVAFNEILDRWQKHAGLGSGESGASPSS